MVSILGIFLNEWATLLISDMISIEFLIQLLLIRDGTFCSQTIISFEILA